MDLLDIDIVLPRRSFDVRAALSIGAETVALIGPSGAGKTSLLKAVAGLEHPQSGHISLGEEAWFDSARKIHVSPERRHTGYLPQDYGLFPHLTVEANVRFAASVTAPICCAGSGSVIWPPPTPGSSREGSASGWHWLGHWLASHGFCCSMSHSGRSTSELVSRYAASLSCS
jgi:hypothetical protein